MKTILCFGDSNTHGSNPAGGRFDLHTRWPGVMRDQLGTDYWVIEEGLGGRTTVFTDPIEDQRCGKDHLLPILRSHKPLDLVIVLLGTNDMKARFGVNPFDIALGAGVLVEAIQKSDWGAEAAPPRVLLAAPPPFAPLAGTPFEQMFAGGEEKSRQIGRAYQRVAAERGCDFFDTSSVIVSSPLDGIHWEASEHGKLGLALADVVRRLLA